MMNKESKFERKLYEFCVEYYNHYEDIRVAQPLEMDEFNLISVWISGSYIGSYESLNDVQESLGLNILE